MDRKEKALLVLAVAFLFSIILIGCGGKKSALNNTTWTISGAKADSGIEVTADTLKVIGVDDFKFVFKKGGKVIVTCAGEVEKGTWKEEDNVVDIKMDDESVTANIEGDKLFFSQDGITVFFDRQG
ncbi:MAG: hypothetical protein ACFWTJ_00070 [Lachnoclostridium sp.]|jgi:hypothetical protein